MPDVLGMEKNPHWFTKKNCYSY